MSIFLGIDPGFGRLGYGLINTNPKLALLDYGVIETPANSEIGSRLVKIEKDLNQLLSRFSIKAAGVENVFFRKNLTTGIPLIESRGVVRLTLARQKIPIYDITPTNLKKILTGNGKATKSMIQKMILRLCSLEKIKSTDDATDGIALALVASMKQKVYDLQNYRNH